MQALVLAGRTLCSQSPPRSQPKLFYMYSGTGIAHARWHCPCFLADCECVPSLLASTSTPSVYLFAFEASFGWETTRAWGLQHRPFPRSPCSTQRLAGFQDDSEAPAPHTGKQRGFPASVLQGAEPSVALAGH